MVADPHPIRALSEMNGYGKRDAEAGTTGVRAVVTGVVTAARLAPLQTR
jgi:hypothetical protein